MASPKVQHVSKAASEKLLVKFSDVSVYDFVYSGGPSPKESSNTKKKTNKKNQHLNVAAAGEGIRSLSPRGKNKTSTNDKRYGVTASRELFLNGSVSSTARKTGLTAQLRSVGSVKSSQLAVAQIKTHALFMGAAEKAWRKALRGASRFLMDKRAVQPVRLQKELL